MTRLSDAEIRPPLEADTVDIHTAILMPGYNDILQDTMDAQALGPMVDSVAEVPCTVWLLVPNDWGHSAEEAALDRAGRRMLVTTPASEHEVAGPL